MRFASASCVLTVALASACVTSPRPLPPRRVAFTQPPAPVQRPADLPKPTEPPIVHERYAHWTLLADAAAVVPLVYWMWRPDDVYLAAPALLLPPLIHIAEEESEHAVVSLLMRGAMVGAVYLAGRSAETECDNSDEFICVPIRSFILAQAAMVSVITIDAVFLARSTRRKDSWYRLPLQPAVGVSGDGRAWLSVGGQF